MPSAVPLGARCPANAGAEPRPAEPAARGREGAPDTTSAGPGLEPPRTSGGEEGEDRGHRAGGWVDTEKGGQEGALKNRGTWRPGDSPKTRKIRESTKEGTAGRRTGREQKPGGRGHRSRPFYRPPAPPVPPTGGKGGSGPAGRRDVSRRYPPHFGPAAPGKVGRGRPGGPARPCRATRAATAHPGRAPAAPRGPAPCSPAGALPPPCRPGRVLTARTPAGSAPLGPRALNVVTQRFRDAGFQRAV